MNLKSRIEKLESRAPADNRPWAQLIAQEGEDVTAQVAELERAGHNVIVRRLVTPKPRPGDVIH
ncbi:MAG TPA: hypothetical protein VI457_10940 [Methylococcaceae bacterium]|nr:hypothetical protein [Methylococcaceae bacterium]